MAEAAKKAGHPSGDDRYKAIDLAMKRFKFEKDALLEVLNTAQETFGYLSEDLLIYVSTKLGVPLSQVYGVATFYHLFTFSPLGDHNCIVCTGTACHVKGSADMVEALSAEYNIQPVERHAVLMQQKMRESNCACRSRSFWPSSCSISSWLMLARSPVLLPSLP